MEFAVGQAIPLRRGYTADQLCRLGRQVKDVAQARRLLAIAGCSMVRPEATRIGGKDRQTLRDWVIGFNEEGPDGLINLASPGGPPKNLVAEHRAFLGHMVEDGPLLAVHSAVRWRACDLIARLQEEVWHVGVGRHVIPCLELPCLEGSGLCPFERPAEGLSLRSRRHIGVFGARLA
jgi:hypothetical protein